MTHAANIVDFETKSVISVKDVGAWCYAEHPSTEIMCLGYKLARGDDAALWLPSQPFPQGLLDAIANDEMFEAHNVQFERAIWLKILLDKMNIPMPRRWACTLSVCAYRGLPLGLDQVGAILNLETKKDKRGKYLLNQLSSPRKPNKKERKEFDDLGLAPDQWPVLWREDPDLMEELGDYCITDVKAEKALGDCVGILPTPEYRVWVLDQTINQRGVKLDLELVESAISVVETITADMTDELRTITKGAVTTANERDRILAWLHAQGFVDFIDLTKASVQAGINHVTAAVKEDQDVNHVLRVLQIRQELSRNSTQKLYTMRDCVCADGRARGLLQYHGAFTGRWSGRIIQPQNFPRGAKHIEDMDEVVSLIKLGGRDGVEALRMIYGDPMEAVSSALRGVIVSEPDHVLRIADFSAIEAVGTAWLAGEEWKLEAFRNKEPIYERTAEMILGRPVVGMNNHDDRMVGKVCELAFGFGGGVGAWLNFDKSGRYREDEIQFFKKQWRNAHPMTTALWANLDEAAKHTITTGKRSRYRHIQYEMVDDAAGHWLTCILPNGRRLWYKDPRIEIVNKGWGDMQSIVYSGRDAKLGGGWSDWIETYGGSLTENSASAICRDLLVEGMIKTEAAKYPTVLSVHDELIAECHKDHGSQDEFYELMSTTPPWAEGFPITAKGGAVTRYRKL